MKKTLHHFFNILIPLLFLFPLFKESISTFIVLLLAITTLCHSIIENFNTFNKKILLFTIPFWLISCNTLYYSINFKGLEHIQHALFFLVIPVCFSLIPKIYFNLSKLDFYFFLLKASCLLITIGYIYSFFSTHEITDLYEVSYNTSGFRNYIYNDLTLFRIHPTYFTTLLIFCITHAAEKVISKKDYRELFFIIPFILISFLLLSKINIFFLIPLLLYIIIFRTGYSKRKKSYISFSFIAGIILLIQFTPGIKDRLNEMYHSFNQQPKGLNYDSTNIRSSIFKCSIAIIEKNIVTGTGFPFLQDNLNHCYSENIDSPFYEKINYMTHNYYFYILASCGIFGFLLYLFYLKIIIHKVFKINVFICTIFVLNILIVCCTEDFFYRHYGILYFNLMLMSFIKYDETRIK